MLLRGQTKLHWREHCIYKACHCEGQILGNCEVFNPKRPLFIRATRFGFDEVGLKALRSSTHNRTCWKKNSILVCTDRVDQACPRKQHTEHFENKTVPATIGANACSACRLKLAVFDWHRTCRTRTFLHAFCQSSTLTSFLEPARLCALPFDEFTVCMLDFQELGMKPALQRTCWWAHVRLEDCHLCPMLMLLHSPLPLDLQPERLGGLQPSPALTRMTINLGEAQQKTHVRTDMWATSMCNTESNESGCQLVGNSCNCYCICKIS